MDSYNSLSYLLQHTPVIMQRQGDQVLQERLGVGMSQYRILRTLQDRPNVQQRFLADSLGQTEASVSRQVKLLVKRSMVTVRINSQNRRENVIALTAKGEKLTQAAEEVLNKYHEPAFEQLSDKEQQQLGAILNTIHQHYCQKGKPYACDLPWFSQFGQEVV